VIERAALRRIHVAVGLTEAGARPGVVYNTVALIGPDGYIGRYRKVHVTPFEQNIWMSGDDWPVFELPFGRVGIAICYDKFWPEAFRELTLRGADLFVVPSAWGGPVSPDAPVPQVAEMSRLCDRARAIENTRWLIASCFAGEIGEIAYSAPSHIVDPNGEIIATSAEAVAGLVTARIDLQEGLLGATAGVTGARLIRDRRDDTYRALRGEIPRFDEG